MRNEITKDEKLVVDLKGKPQPILDIEQRLQAAGRLGINIGALEGYFLQTLVSQPHVQKVVEIGTQYGCSTAYMALAMENGGTIYGTEKDETCIVEARRTIEGLKDLTRCKISLLEGAAKETLKSIESEGPFDLVFIDANKSGYLDYYQWAKENLCPGGYLVADNVLLFGTMFQETCPSGTPVKMWTVMKSFLQIAFDDPDFTTSLLPTAEGLLVSVKKSEGLSI